MERRGDERNEASVVLTCRVPARPCRAIILDLSHTGCRLELPDASVELGGTTLLDLPGARRTSGRVVWTSGNVAGIEFDHPLGEEAAIALGLDEPESKPVPPEPDEQLSEPNLRGILPHWIRRLAASS